MNVFVAGGGRVGFHLARLMSNENLNVTVLEEDPIRVEHIDFSLDVRTIRGNGSSVLLLQEAGVAAADLFVSSMGNDETNLIAAAMAKGLGAKKVVARVDAPMYIESNLLYEGMLGVDYILSPDALAALEITQYVENPGVLVSERFGRGLVHMRQIVVDHSFTGTSMALKELFPPGSGVLIGMVERKGRSTIPRGDFVIELDDTITLIGHKDRIDKFQRLFHRDEVKPQRIAIMGGGIVAQRTAQALQGKVKSIKILERNESLATKLAEKFPNVTVMCRDGSNRATMEEEQIDHHDMYIAATNDDERNIMSSVLAKDMGCKIVAALVHQPDFAPLVRRLGIDVAITPRASIANRILKLIHQDEVTSLAVLSEGYVEVVEFTVAPASPVLNMKLKEFDDKFPKDALVATIIRDDEVFVPGGEDRILEGDSIVLIATAASLEAAQSMLQKR